MLPKAKAEVERRTKGFPIPPHLRTQHVPIVQRNFQHVSSIHVDSTLFRHKETPQRVLTFPCPLSRSSTWNTGDHVQLTQGPGTQSARTRKSFVGRDRRLTKRTQRFGSNWSDGISHMSLSTMNLRSCSPLLLLRALWLELSKAVLPEPVLLRTRRTLMYT